MPFPFPSPVDPEVILLIGVVGGTLAVVGYIAYRTAEDFGGEVNVLPESRQELRFPSAPQIFKQLSPEAMRRRLIRV